MAAYGQPDRLKRLFVLLVVLTTCCLVFLFVTTRVKDQTNYLPPTSELPTTSNVPPIDQLSWTSLNNGHNSETNFFSAYYDGRKGVPGRPAVVVIGYNMRSVTLHDLHYVFTYANKTSVCQAEPARKNTACIDEVAKNKLAASFTYICTVKCKAGECTEDEVPTFVALSNNSDCAGASGQIPVRNRQLPRASEKKSFGVCVESPVFGYSIGVQQILAFIEMNRALGAEMITLYVMEMKEDVLQFMLDHYSQHGLLQLVKWRKFDKWNPLHYYGETLIMHDCLYRNMHRVKYIAMVDLDEILVPLKHRNWPEMISAIGGHDKYHGYLFLNCFFTNKSTKVSKVTLPCHLQVNVPNYFQWTRICYCEKHARTKYMIRTEFTVGMYIHFPCQALKEKSVYNVPRTVGITAHYRTHIPGKCSKKITHDTKLQKYQSTVVEAMGQQMCSHSRPNGYEQNDGIV